MFCERTSVGLDVHARSVVAAAIDGCNEIRANSACPLDKPSLHISLDPPMG